MFSRVPRAARWLMLLASGSFLLQAATSCTNVNETLQTGLLGGIAAGLFFLAQNV